MKIPQGMWRNALARALFVSTSLTATPAVACELMAVDELARKLPGARRHDVDGSLLAPFLALWEDRRGAALPLAPDGVTVFASRDRPLLIAFRRAGCLVALLPSLPADLWRAMRRHIGPIA